MAANADMTEKSPGGLSQGPPPPPSYDEPSSQPPAYGAPHAHGHQMGATTSVILTQPTLPIIQVFRDVPVRTTCSACGATVLTSTSYQSGTLTWLVCIILALMGLWLGCCFIPFCINECKDVVHSCPNCRHTIGTYNRM